MARGNPSWGYDRIVGAIANLNHQVSDQTVGNILKRHDIPRAPKRKQTTSWKDFIRAHMAARNVTIEETGFLANRRYLLHDRDSKCCPSFRQLIEAET